MEPFVKILYSECEDTNLQTDCVMSLGNANSLFEKKDFICQELKTIENIVYKISYKVKDELRTYICSQNFGAGDGSVINHLRKETIESLETLDYFDVQPAVESFLSKNPFGVLKSACENMLQYVLPELEAYCLAYRTNEIVYSYNIDNCNPALRSSMDELVSFVKTKPKEFIESLEKVIDTNPDNISLIFAVENIIDKTENYMSFVDKKDGVKEGLVEVLKEASQRASVINSKSVFYGIEPPEEATTDIYR